MCTVTATASLIGRCPWSFQLIDSMLPCASPETDDGQVSEFVTSLWSLLRSNTEQTHHNMESIHFIQWLESEKTTNLPCTAWLFEDFCLLRYFPSQKRYVSSLLILFRFILLVDSFTQTFFKAFTCSVSIGESLCTLFASLTYAYHYLMTLIK